MKVNKITGALDILGNIFFLAAVMNHADKILVHGMANVGGIRHIGAIHNILDIGISPAVGHFRRQAAFNGRPGAERNKHNL